MRWLISAPGRSLVAGVVFGMVFELSAVVLASSWLFILYVGIVHPKSQSSLSLFDLVKCEAGDEPIGERTIALFLVEQGFVSNPYPKYFLANGVTDIDFSRSDLVYLTVFPRHKREPLEIRYDYFPDADPGPKTVTARDMARFERAGFRPAGSCEERGPQPR